MFKLGQDSLISSTVSTSFLSSRTAGKKYASLAEPSGITESFENVASDRDLQTYCDIAATEVDNPVHPNVRPSSFHLRFNI